MNFDSISTSAVIPAEPKAVYTAWMSSKGHSEHDRQRGNRKRARRGRLSAWDGYISGKTLELKSPSPRILQAWRTTEFAAEDPDSMLEVLLEEAKGGTKVTLKHTNIPAGHGAEYKKGWIDFYFKPMKEYFSKKA